MAARRSDIQISETFSDPGYNEQYLATPDNAFNMAIFFFPAARDGILFKWVNLKIYPRLADQLPKNLINMELKENERLAEYYLRVDVDQEPERAYFLCRVEQGKKFIIPNKDQMKTYCRSGSDPVYLSHLCLKYTRAISDRADHPEDRFDTFTEMLDESDDKILKGWRHVTRPNPHTKYVAKKLRDNDQFSRPDSRFRLDPIPECINGPFATDEELVLLTKPPEPNRQSLADPAAGAAAGAAAGSSSQSVRPSSQGSTDFNRRSSLPGRQQQTSTQRPASQSVPPGRGGGGASSGVGRQLSSSSRSDDEQRVPKDFGGHVKKSGKKSGKVPPAKAPPRRSSSVESLVSTGSTSDENRDAVRRDAKKDSKLPAKIPLPGCGKTARAISSQVSHYTNLI